MKIGDIRPGMAFARMAYVDSVALYLIIHVEHVIGHKVKYSALRIYEGTSRVLQYWGHIEDEPPFSIPRYWQL